MGIKYHFEVKDNKLADRFQRLHPGEAPSKPGMRAPKKLTRRELARLAKRSESEESKDN